MRPFTSVYLVQDYHSLSCFLSDFIMGKMSSNHELSASTSSCDDESLGSMGEAEGSFNSIVQPYQDGPIADVQEGDEIGEEEEEEDDEDGMRFAILESRFENKETVSNYQVI